MFFLSLPTALGKISTTVVLSVHVNRLIRMQQIYKKYMIPIQKTSLKSVLEFLWIFQCYVRQRPHESLVGRVRVVSWQSLSLRSCCSAILKVCKAALAYNLIQCHTLPAWRRPSSKLDFQFDAGLWCFVKLRSFGFLFWLWFFGFIFICLLFLRFGAFLWRLYKMIVTILPNMH